MRYHKSIRNSEQPTFVNRHIRCREKWVDYNRTDHCYDSHRFLKGKPELEVMSSNIYRIKAILSYTIFKHLDVITCSVRFENAGSEKLRLLNIANVNVDFHDADFDIVMLPGAHIRERYFQNDLKKRSSILGLSCC